MDFSMRSSSMDSMTDNRSGVDCVADNRGGVDCMGGNMRSTVVDCMVTGGHWVSCHREVSTDWLDCVDTVVDRSTVDCMGDMWSTVDCMDCVVDW